MRGFQFNPEGIAIALFNLISTAVSAKELSFPLISRNASLLQDPDMALLPSLIMVEMGGTQDQKQARGLGQYLLQYVVVIRTAPSSDPNPINLPQTFLNKAWSAIDTALKSIPEGDYQTLGGIVTNAWIEGPVLMQPGVLKNLMPSVEIPIKVQLGIR